MRRFRFNDFYSESSLLVTSCGIAFAVISVWIIRSWEYLPEWAPVPGPALMNLVSCLRPFFLIICGLPTAIAFSTGLIAGIKLLTNSVSIKNLRGVVNLGICLIILSTSTLPLIFKDKLQQSLQSYAISRYNVVIDAIEEYQTIHGHYPLSLEALIPEYLSAVPGKYMKFGEELNYYPDPSTSPRGYSGHGPFIFELTGMYEGIHGQTLKYCPAYDSTCKVFRSRIDDRWVWAYSTVL